VRRAVFLMVMHESRSREKVAAEERSVWAGRR